MEIIGDNREKKEIEWVTSLLISGLTLLILLIYHENP